MVPGGQSERHFVNDLKRQSTPSAFSTPVRTFLSGLLRQTKTLRPAMTSLWPARTFAVSVCLALGCLWIAPTAWAQCSDALHQCVDLNTWISPAYKVQYTLLVRLAGNFVGQNIVSAGTFYYPTTPSIHFTVDITQTTPETPLPAQYNLSQNLAISTSGPCSIPNFSPTSMESAAETVTFSDPGANGGTCSISVTNGSWNLSETNGYLVVPPRTIVVHYTVLKTPPGVFTVTTLTDDATGVAAHCTNQALPGAKLDASCSLRDAIAAAEAAYHVDTSHTPMVNFSSSLQANGAPISNTNPGTYILSGSALTFTSGKLNIVGPGEGALSVSGANESTVFEFANTGDIGISGLTITGGVGGGIYIQMSTGTTVDHCIVSGNSGGGIRLAANSTVTVNYSTISGNTGTNGGGLILAGGGAEATLNYTTVSGNSVASGGKGAGIYNHSSLGSIVNLYNSTVSGNYIQGSGSGAGIYSVYGTDIASLSNSIVDGNWIGTSSTVSQYDDFDDGSGISAYSSVSSANGNGGGNVVGAYNSPSSTQPSPAIHLAPLDYYGGLTQTMIPLPPSPAICAGLVANIPTIAPAIAPATIEQRGNLNTNTSYTNYPGTSAATTCVDAGAVQTSYTLEWAQPPTSPQVANETFFSTGLPDPAVALNESGALVADGQDPITIPLTLTGNGPLGGGSAQTVDGITDPLAGVATYSNLTVGHAGIGDSLAAILTLNSSVTPAPSVSSGSSAFDVVAPVLEFGTAPPDPLTAGGNAGTVTVLVEDGDGDVVTTSTDAITLKVTGPNSYSQTYHSGHAVNGVATFNLDPRLTKAGTYTYTASMDHASGLIATETVIAASPHSITVAGGAVQSAAIGTAFATALTVTVEDTYLNPVSGATVTFTPPASGASATLTTPAATDATGQTSVTATANGTAGGYTVTAAVGAASASFSLTNTAIAPTLSISCYSGAYDGNPHTCTGTATGLGGVTVSGTWSFNPGSETAAGSYPETGTFTSTDSSYSTGGTASNTLTITAIAPTLSISCYSGAYDGNPHTCTGTATGIGSVPVSGTWSFNPGSETAANSYPETGTFTSTNSSYSSGGKASNTLTITRALLTVTANNTSMTMGAAVPALTYTITGFAGADTSSVVAGTATEKTTASSSSSAGTYPITFSTEALTAANYTFTYVSGSLSVVQAPTASLTGSSTVSGSASAGYQVTITIRNTGNGPASNVTLATATLGSASGTPLPQSLGTIAAGASGTFTVNFPGSVGADGAAVAEKYTGTYTGGTFTGSVRAVTLP